MKRAMGIQQDELDETQCLRIALFCPARRAIRTVLGPMPFVREQLFVGASIRSMGAAMSGGGNVRP